MIQKQNFIFIISPLEMYFSYYMEMPDLMYIDFKELLEFFFLVMCLYIIIKIRFIRNKPKQTWFFNKLFNKYLSRVKMFNNQVIDFLTFTTFETILQSINFYKIKSINFYKIKYYSVMHNSDNFALFSLYEDGKLY